MGSFNPEVTNIMPEGKNSPDLGQAARGERLGFDDLTEDEKTQVAQLQNRMGRGDAIQLVLSQRDKEEIN